MHLGACGLDVNKIALMGRWFCAIVLHYTRLSPITDIARDLKRARTKQGIDETVKSISLGQKKIKEAVNSMIGDIQAEVSALQGRVEAVSRECRPRGVVVNRTTGKVHKVLTSVLDAGEEAVATCGLKYAFCPKLFCDEIPACSTRSKVCGTCFRGLRDELPR